MSPVTTCAKNYSHGTTIAPHKHDHAQLIYASAGVMTVTTDQGAWVVPRNRAVWVPLGVRHSIQMFGCVEMRTLYFAPKVGAGFVDHCCVLNVHPLLRELIVHVVSRKRINPSDARQSRLVAVILDLLEVSSKAPLHLPMPRDSRALCVSQMLQANPADGRGLEELGKFAYSSKRTLERLFQLEIGMSFRTWRCQLRVQHALTLLASGRSVTAVALDLGYSSTSAFVAMFHRVLGSTPGKYFVK